MSEDRGEHRPWPAGRLLLLLGGGLSGLLFYMFGRGGEGAGWSLTQDSLSFALAMAAALAGFGFAFTVERERWRWSLVLLIGIVLAAVPVFYWSGPPSSGDRDLHWRYVAFGTALAAALPLFQAMRDEGRWRFPYVAVHWYAWTDLAAALAAAAVALAVVLLLRLAGADLLDPGHWDSPWAWAIVGAALALLIGLLRSFASAVDLQLPLRRVLALLAPVMLLAVLALPLIAARTGSLAAASLALALGAMLFANAVLGNGPDQESGNPLLGYAAMALSALLLPLSVIAGIAIWMRIGEHGYTPSRLWAGVIALAIAAIGIRYLASLLRRRMLWAEPVRRNNIRILGTMVFVSVALASPLVSFSSIATRDQMARLEDGRIPPAEFDWRALRFQFGRNGVRALSALREGVETSPEVRGYAARALLAQSPEQMQGPAPARP